MSKKSIYIKVRDYSVSGEDFELRHDEALDMLITTPQPSAIRLPDYYQSEDYISHTDGRRNIFEKVYQFVKSIALKRKLKLINAQVKDTKTLLDMGSGTGDFLKIASQNGWSVTGIEPNEQARKAANQKVQNRVFDIDVLYKLEHRSFDVITLWHVLEHLPDVEAHLAVFNKLLKPDGVLIIAVPNFKSFDASYYKGFWAAYDVPRHLWHFSQMAMSSLVSSQHMIIAKILPMTFDAYYVCLLSEKYKTGIMNPIKAFWIGWRSNRKASTSGEYSSLIYVIKNKPTTN